MLSRSLVYFLFSWKYARSGDKFTTSTLQINLAVQAKERLRDVHKIVGRFLFSFCDMEQEITFNAQIVEDGGMLIQMPQ